MEFTEINKDIKLSFNVKYGIDYHDNALKTFEYNHKNAKGIKFNISCEDLSELNSKISNIDVIIGSPPCQGFSLAGVRDPNDPRNNLSLNYFNFVKKYKPSYFLLENVPGIIKWDKFSKLKTKIKSLDYSYIGLVVNASDFYVPQNRKRFILFGWKNGLYPPELSNLTKLGNTSVFESISDIEVEQYTDKNLTYPHTSENLSLFQKYVRMNSDYAQDMETTVHSEQMVEKYSLIEPGKKLDEDLIKEKNIATGKKKKIPIYKLDPNNRCKTITVQRSDFVHYKFPRVLTIREMARLQSFPDYFLFPDDVVRTTTGATRKGANSREQQIGNAVPPLLSLQLAYSIWKGILLGYKLTGEKIKKSEKTNLFLISDLFNLPAREKPWQGGPPITMS